MFYVFQYRFLEIKNNLFTITKQSCLSNMGTVVLTVGGGVKNKSFSKYLCLAFDNALRKIYTYITFFLTSHFTLLLFDFYSFYVDINRLNRY